MGLGAGAAGRDLTPAGVSGGLSSTQGPEGRELACAVLALSKEARLWGARVGSPGSRRGRSGNLETRSRAPGEPASEGVEQKLG